MTAFLPTILIGALSLLLAVVMITAAVIAHRGKSFWGTWMMLIGSIGFVLGTVTAAVASFFLFQHINTSLATPSPASASTSNLATFSIISGIGSLISAGGVVLYLIGILGVVVRYGAIAKRIEDLETINASLISQNEQSNS